MNITQIRLSSFHSKHRKIPTPPRPRCIRTTPINAHGHLADPKRTKRPFVSSFAVSPLTAKLIRPSTGPMTIKQVIQEIEVRDFFHRPASSSTARPKHCKSTWAIENLWPPGVLELGGNCGHQGRRRLVSEVCRVGRLDKTLLTKIASWL